MNVIKKFFPTKRILKIICLLVTVGILCINNSLKVYAAETGTTEESTLINEPGTAEEPEDLMEANIANTVTITYNNGNGEFNGALRILITLTLIAIAPILLIMLTCYTRVIIVLHFTRAALNTQTAPPNQVLIGLALFLTLFIMSPVLNAVNETAVQPLSAGEISVEEAWEAGQKPIREFMINQLGNSDSELRIFLDLAGIDEVNSADDVPMSALIPAFILSELKKAFIMGFLIYLPFIVIDMVVSSTLMAMGMMMLPPTTISMPFKILLFVLADGWNLVIGNLVRTFY